MAVHLLEHVAVPLISPITPGPTDVISGLIPKKGQVLISGETNVGKSLIALEICSSLVTMQPLWGEIEPNEQLKRIVYVLGEHYNEVIQRLWQLTGLPMTDQVWLLGPDKLGSDKWLVHSGRPNSGAIDKFKGWVEGADLVVFAPLSAFLCGSDVENDNSQMRLLLDIMSGITQSAGASCLILAHQGKPSMDRFGQEHHRMTYAIRGASAIEDAATNIFYMHKHSDIQQEGGSNPNLFRLKCRKYKGIAPDFYYLLRNEETKVHRLINSNRPNSDLKKAKVIGRVTELQIENSLTLTKAVEAAASEFNIGDRMVWRYLKG